MTIAQQNQINELLAAVKEQAALLSALMNMVEMLNGQVGELQRKQDPIHNQTLHLNKRKEGH